MRCAKSYASRSRVSTDLEMCDESINCKLGFCKTIIVDMVANGEHAENIGATICGEHDGEPFGVISSKWTRGESEDDLQGLVAAMRKGYDEFKVKYGANSVGADDVSELRSRKSSENCCEIMI